jgi:hypothetical protein
MDAPHRSFSFVFLTLLNLNAAAAVHYVDVNSAAPTPPYTNWATAASVIQDAVAAAQDGDIVLVTNGLYDIGGDTLYFSPVTNRVLLVHQVTLQSVNGPQLTFIRGRAASGPGQKPVRCAYIGSNAVLSGFTLTNGHSGGVMCQTGAVVTNCIIIGSAGPSGAGVSGGTLYNCVIAQNNDLNADGGGGGGAFLSTLYSCVLSNNSVSNQPGQGGGAYQCTLYNCVLYKNYAPNGGGAAYSTLYNCTLSANVAANQGGGVYACTSDNCIIYFNSAPYGSQSYLGSQYYCNTCCPLPFPPPDPNTVTNDPVFVNLAAGDLHLQSNSPCINSGHNAYVFGSSDLDGNPRIVSSAVDIGAYEFQTPASAISYAWLNRYGFPTDGSADYSDPDGDGMNNWQEWIAGTNPTNALSVLQMRPLILTTNLSGVNVRWQSVSGRSYFLQRSTNLGVQPAFSILQSNIVGNAGTTTYTDTNAAGATPFFYRVGVQ